MSGDSQVEAVARILLETWDPIGIRDVDANPEREYVSEAERVLALLNEGAGREELARYLWDAAETVGARGPVHLSDDDVPPASLCMLEHQPWEDHPAAGSTSTRARVDGPIGKGRSATSQSGIPSRQLAFKHG